MAYPLRLATRQIAKHRGLRPRLWKYIERLREYYSRFDPPLEMLSSYEGGIKITTSLSSHIEAQIFWQGFQEADEGTVTCLKACLPKDGVFIDVGANVGTFTLVGAQRAPRGEVHAFEPSEYHFARLSRNVAMNGFNNVRMNKAGLFDRPAEGQLFLPATTGAMNNSGGASLFGWEAGSLGVVEEEVRLLRLDDYVEAHRLGRIDVIKIDIEGAELNALLGAIKTLGTFRPIVLMELDRDNLKRAGRSLSDILSFWAELRYQLAAIHSDGTTLAINGESDLKPHQNLLCTPSRDDYSGAYPGSIRDNDVGANVSHLQGSPAVSDAHDRRYRQGDPVAPTASRLMPGKAIPQ
jgi:FkbM family methyltransferase